MAQYTTLSRKDSRRSSSEPISGIPLSKISKHSMIDSISNSHEASSRHSPFLTPPITPIERTEIPYKVVEQEYFSLSQRSLRKNRRTNTRSLPASSASNAPPELNDDNGTLRDSRSQTMSQRPPRLIENVCDTDETVSINPSQLPGSQMGATAGAVDLKTHLPTIETKNGAQTEDEGSQPSSKGSEVLKSISRAVTDFLTAARPNTRPSTTRQQSNQDTPAMITLRKASIISARGSILFKDVAVKPPLHPLLKTSNVKTLNRKSEAETALTIVTAHASSGEFNDGQPNSAAERRGSTLAVIITRQGSHEIIWKFDDTPSSYSSSSSERQSQKSGLVIPSRHVAPIQE